MIGYPDTFWYGADDFNICRHAKGMHTVKRHRQRQHLPLRPPTRLGASYKS